VGRGDQPRLRGNIYHDKGELDQALKYYEEALAISREIGDQWVVASSLSNLGSIYHDRGELDKALRHHEQALAMSRDNGDLWGTASSLSNIGSIYRDKGRLAEALKYDNGALKVARNLGHLLGVATDLGNVGLILTDRSEHEQAVPKLADSLITLLNMGVANGPRQTLTGLAGCDDKLGRRRLVETAGACWKGRRSYCRPPRPRRPDAYETAGAKQERASPTSHNRLTAACGQRLTACV